MFLLLGVVLIFVACSSSFDSQTCNIKSISSNRCPKWTPKQKADKEAVDGDRVYLENNIGASCLDGTDPVFYYRTGSGTGTNKFHIFFEGGGACVGLNTAISPNCFDSCAGRATGDQGSSNNYPAVTNFDSEYMSTNSTENPLSYNWNTIYVKYCDGGMFLGDNDTPQQTDDDRLIYYRGRKIMIAVFDELVNNYAFDAATDVLVSGCSAGAAAVYGHANFINDNYVPNSAGYLAMPDSAFFVEYGFDSEFRKVIDWIYLNQNTSSSLDPNCVADHPFQPYQCNWAEFAAPYINVLTFALQSQYDLFQLNCEVNSNFPGPVNEYAEKFRQVFFDSYLENGNYNQLHGAFLDSCSRHCGAWDGFQVDGDFSGQAQLKWYNNHGENDQRVWFQNEQYPCLGCCGRFD